MIVDESHVTLSQVHAMYGGTEAEENLVEYLVCLPLWITDLKNLKNLKRCKTK
jgi:excinuclease UvrABC helicase subunit UvrB